MFKYLLIFIITYTTLLHPSTPYIKQIKVWDDCTYAMEVIRIDLMKLKDKHFEDINADAAIKLCKKSLNEYPDDPHVKFLLARAYTKAKRYAEGFSLTSEACKKGDIGGCTLLAGYHDSYLISKKNQSQKSILLWLWSCAQGDSQACTNLYMKAERDENFMPKEMRKGEVKLLHLCTRGDYPLACHTYARNCSRDRVYSDECKYTSSRSCISGNEEGCSFYRSLWGNIVNKEGMVQEKSYVYQKSCNNGNVEACLLVAHAYAAKKRTKINNITALALYEDSCKNGLNATACRYAGAYYLAELKGITQNIPLGLSYLESSCKPRTTYKETANSSITRVDYDIQGCLDLAKYYLYAPQNKYGNTEKAKSTLKQACELREYYYTTQLGCQLQIDSCCKHIKK